MKRVVAILGLVLLAASACAQTTMLKVNIPFDFVAGKAILPAGDYEFNRISEDSIRIINISTSRSVILPAITRLAPEPNGKPRVTFDVVGDRKILESIWSGTDDGYLFGITKGKHTHHTVTTG